ncbi:MAG TPA: DNA cytosine methyltransferase [Thermoanaerobaculia bacterium]|nr:DNA cytosine methyltransferase [Thermoanaerobaculia bacterium]
MGKIPTVISLYSGAGGIDYGFEAAGFQTRVALDFDHDSCETIRRNRDWPVLEGDIFAIPTADILRTARLDAGEADILIGGPPCQPFSKAGYWARGESGRLRDPRAATLDGYLRVLEDTLPKSFLLENVHGIAYSAKNEGLRLLLREIEKINERNGTAYKPVGAVLNAAGFGVPQIRERFFLIASRDGKPFAFPSPSYCASDGEQTLIRLPTYRTAWDAIGDLQESSGESLDLTGKWADLLPSIPEGWNYLWHTDRGGGLPLFGWRRRYWSFLLKLSKSLPSWTIQAQPGPAIGPFHWKNRRLSMRELCRLQTFPDDVVIYGSRTSVQRQVGNAVPSLLAEVLAREISSQLLGRRTTHDLRLLTPDLSPAPPAETPQPVARKYHFLIAQHDPHPGNGRGPGSRRAASSE